MVACGPLYQNNICIKRRIIQKFGEIVLTILKDAEIHGKSKEK